MDVFFTGVLYYQMILKHILNKLHKHLTFFYVQWTITP
jgi:hypothetical protein